MHRITLLYSESVALNVTKGLFAWVLAVQPKSGLSLVYLKKELFKFSLPASVMVPCMSCHLFQDITNKNPLHFAPLAQIYSVSELQKVV